MWGVITMVMKTIIDDPQGSLVAGCVIFFLVIIFITLIAIIASSLGYGLSNTSVWWNAFYSELSFIMGLLMGGNLREKHI